MTRSRPADHPSALCQLRSGRSVMVPHGPTDQLVRVWENRDPLTERRGTWPELDVNARGIALRCAARRVPRTWPRTLASTRAMSLSCSGNSASRPRTCPTSSRPGCSSCSALTASAPHPPGCTGRAQTTSHGERSGSAARTRLHPSWSAAPSPRLVFARETPARLGCVVGGNLHPDRRVSRSHHGFGP